ncbi:MAG: TAT-variant-translocated molybdopterin oxidoreductase [Bdellovibrionaceae bacterium]|nr:TAT-variant-translocated molybdopterin oxidoreductase [Pseudobdellovibrionaceae bacterium]
MSEQMHGDQGKENARMNIERDTKYWLSLEHYQQNPDFMKLASQEFTSSPLQSEDGNDNDGWGRREFLKLMGASLALSTAGCIRRPVQKIVPYNSQPEEVTLTVPNFYTSSHFDGSEVLGLLVKTREGRPIKVEGNPSHPLNLGGISSRAQASLLSLYDPERLQGPRKNLFNEKRSNKDTIPVKWEEMDDKVTAQLKRGSVVVLTGSLSSPATRSVVREFCQAFAGQHVTWEPLSHEEIREGQKACYGEALVPQYRIDQAQIIVAVDADFLGTWLQPVAFTKQFAKVRRNISQMSRLISFDSNYSLTGANSDIRFKIKPSQQLSVVMGLLHEIVVVQGKSSFANNSAVKTQLAPYSQAAQQLGVDAALWKKLASDLWEHRGRSLVLAGGLQSLTANQHALQVAVNFLNSVLENDGKTVLGKSGNPGLLASGSEMVRLIGDMQAGKVKTLIIHGTNPGYGLPSSSGFVEALKKVEMVIYTGDRLDETGDHAHYIIPDNHAMESWGDAETVAGVYTIQQPTIRPMYDTRSVQLSLMTWAYLAKQGPKRLLDYETFYDYLKNFWKEEIFPAAVKAAGKTGTSFEVFWGQALQDGYVGSQKDSTARTFKTEAFTQLKIPSQTTSQEASSGYEVVLYPTVQLGDGTQSNISWLHELPDVMTKITWDNYVCLSLATAEKNKLKEGALVEVTVGATKQTLPVHIQPGLHDSVLAIPVGYGRTKAGKIANGIGQNAYELMNVKGDSILASGMAATLTATGKIVDLACTQGHHSMEGRQIVVEATLKDYLKQKDANIHKHHIWNIWSGHAYDGHKWGMGVDLNSCTGCSSCMIACQSENNYPAVGKKYVLQGREMHWIRIDRYYSGTPESPETVFQPVMCQHCDNAPCESVCPVLATVHSNEGLNEMVYNRCVGTRYCSNNCPYKVRRFNWFSYAKLTEKPLNLALNPDVTPRVRGVMEKCTFCVQRIKDGKNKAKLEGRPLRDGEIKTACQVACPADAIVFGDTNDPKSAVSQMMKDERGYALLEEWHAAPAVRYLSKIRNNDKGGEHS